MIVGGLLLLCIGLADLSRQFVGRGTRRSRAIASVGTIALVCLIGLGVVQLKVVLLVGALALIWVALMPSGKERAAASFWPAPVLAAIVLVLLATSNGRADGWIAEWWLTTDLGVSVPLPQLVLLAGVFAFLLESANIVVRTALHSEGVASESEGVPAATEEAQPAAPSEPPGRVKKFLAKLRPPVEDEARSSVATLRGGRLIGPLERLFLVGLIFTSAGALIAAFIAAKGIVRFPEIQKDEEHGTQAEYFLVGSMTSWATALAGSGLLWLTETHKLIS